MSTDYKATLNLPRTEFPMKANLPQREPELLAWWEQARLYERIQEAGPQQPKGRYILHDGPPYANGRIHIGHALNKILKDIIIKSKTMEGHWAPYVPGWDCHGLPIEHQVLKELGDKKKDLDTPAIRKLCRDYAEKYLNIQRDEFKRLGVLGDWDHPYLTMDPAYEATILREFGKFVERGGVYKGLKPVLWCPVDETALAEAEVEYADHLSPSIYVMFRVTADPLSVFGTSRSSLSFVIWTTTPWTLVANEAVCLHPDFDYQAVRVVQEGKAEKTWIIAKELVEKCMKEFGVQHYQILETYRGADLEGVKCCSPFLEYGSSKSWPSVVICGRHVTLEQGTGCVHTAPGHGQEDYEVGLRYELPIYAPVDSRGRFTEEIDGEVAGFRGIEVLRANKAIIQRLTEVGTLVKGETITHSYPHCWRCKQPVIFRATEQWFVSMEINELRLQALHEIEQVKWIPSWGRDRIHGMISNRPDWCLSRQRVWGVPIPGFTCTACKTVLADPKVIDHVVGLVAKQGADVWFQKSAGELLPAGTTCPKCGEGAFEKERDILDVWFESGVSHAAVLKPRQWWPADLYLEGSDQHRGWFHSALLTGVTTDKQAPYKAALTHGFVVDGAGKKMSKSAGNVVAPQDVIKQSGAEILRLWVAAQDYREDLRISQEILTQLVEAYRKIRNTCRFLLSNLYDFDPVLHRVPFEQLPELDRWALMKLGELIPRVRRAYEEFEFHAIFHALNNFCSVDMSAVYLDILKDRLYTFHRDSLARRSSQTVLLETLVALTKLMAPILSFTSEELWRMLPEAARGDGDRPSVHLAAFPDADPRWEDGQLKERWERLLAVRAAVQAALEVQRRDKVIGSSLEARVLIKANPERFEFLRSYEQDLPALFIVSQVQLNEVHNLPFTPDFLVSVEKAGGTKCERCWNYRDSVGEVTEHLTLCDRCVEAIR